MEVEEWRAIDIDGGWNSYGTGIDGFMEWMASCDNLSQFYSLNLKFDAQFIIAWLYSHGYSWAEDYSKPMTFTTLIASEKMYFILNLHAKVKKFKIFDASKFVKTAKDQTDDLRAKLLEIKAPLKKILEYMPTAVTIGQVALQDFKNRIGIRHFQHLFPTLNQEDVGAIRQAYSGGWMYLNPIYANKPTGKLVHIDKNSMYPSILTSKPLPTGFAMQFSGECPDDSLLTVQAVRLDAKLKDGKMPVIKPRRSDSPFEFNFRTDIEDKVFWLTNVELDLVKEQYDIYDIEYLDGYAFYPRSGIFDSYVNDWMEQKVSSKKMGDKDAYSVSKLFLNSLVGKFASNGFGRSYEPYIASDGVLNLKALPPEPRKTLYIPISVFVNAYARCELVRTIEKLREFGFKKYGRDVFVYSDTDSIFATLELEDLLSCHIDLHQTRLGAWKIEEICQNARFVKDKEYIVLDAEGVSKATVSGLNKKVAEQLKFESFGDQTVLQPRVQSVKGGAVRTLQEFKV